VYLLLYQFETKQLSFCDVLFALAKINRTRFDILLSNAVIFRHVYSMYGAQCPNTTSKNCFRS